MSQCYIGNCYYLVETFKKIIEWYSKSSKGGNIGAMFYLGCCYFDGDGIM